MTRSIPLTLAVAATISAFSSCQSDKGAKAPVEVAPVVEEASPMDDLHHFKFHKTIANIPYPATNVYLTVKKAASAFDASILHSTDSYSKYVTSQSKALNFGVYSVDLVYLAIFDRQSELKRYFAVSRTLANDLDVQDSFDKAVSSSVIDNMENSDSVLAVINGMYGDIDGYLRSNERLDAATAMLIGSWVEGQYLSLSVVTALGDKATNFEADYGQSIFEQKLTLYNLVSLLEELPNKKDYAKILASLKGVSEVYNGISSADDVKAKLPALLTSMKAARATITQ